MADASAELLVRPGDDGATPPERIEGRSVEAWRREARESLGLADAPVMATGHQSECWHAGILAKNLWAQALAEREGATAVHLVVDQDGFDGMVLEWPFRRPDGWWGVRGHRFGPSGGDLAAMRCPAFRPRAAEPGEGAHAGAARALPAIEASLQRHVSRRDAALQGAHAMLELAGPWMPMPAIVRASDLLRTALARRLLERMVQDPLACARAFNAALTVAPRAARALRLVEGHVELPVWLLGSQGERVRATAPDVARAVQDGTPILPRAFLMSAIARTALSDRFVHGLGGSVYEQATDRWFRGWLGWVPPAYDVVSANARLSLPSPAPPTAEPAGMPWRRAWCDPDLLPTGGSGPSPARRKALELIAALPRGDARRRSAFHDLLADRDAARLRRADELESLQRQEASAGAERLSSELAQRRTWCFAMLDAAQLQALRDAAHRRARSAG